VLPFDAIPDMLPVNGFIDAAAVLAAAVKLAGHITPAHREAARQKVGRIEKPLTVVRAKAGIDPLQPINSVMAGLVPAIHVLLAEMQWRRGCPA
jgi:Protein of unknown function (DUF1232)